MSERKRFCEKYPDLCEKEYYSNYSKSNLGLPIKERKQPQIAQPPRRNITDVEPPPRRDFRPVDEFVPPPRRDFRPIQVPPRRDFRPVRNQPRRDFRPVERDTLGLPTRTKKTTTFAVSEQAETPESLLIAMKEGKEKLKELKIEGLSKIGLGNEVVKESIEQHKYGRLSEASYRYGYGDKAGANDVISKGDYIPDMVDFEIIDPLSTKDYTTLRNKTSGEVVMSFRGSDTKFADVKTLMEDPSRATNVEDWWVNLHTMMGNPEKTQRYKSSTEAVRNVARTLRVEPSDIVFTGHSNGGGNARRQAEIFGAEAITFNGADNPLKDMSNPEKLGGVKEGAKVKAYRTYGDIVSAGHETKTPDHMEVERLTAKAGTETNLIEQHGVEQFFHDNPKVNSSGEIENVRTGKLKNFLGTAGGVAVKSVLGIAGAEAFAPIYADKAVETKEQAFLLADTGKALAFEGMLDPSATLLDAIDVMGMGLQPEEKKHIRKWLGIKEKEPPKSKPPAIITWLSKLTGRYEQDQELKRDRELADEMGLTLNEYLTASHGRGFTGESATEISQEDIDQAQNFADTMSGITQQQQEQIASQDINNADGSFTRGGKTYVEVP